jgi:hypothetical protein
MLQWVLAELRKVRMDMVLKVQDMVPKANKPLNKLLIGRPILLMDMVHKAQGTALKQVK